MKKTKLQSLLRENGMPRSGNKNALFKRVQGIVHQNDRENVFHTSTPMHNDRNRESPLSSENEMDATMIQNGGNVNAYVMRNAANPVQ